MSLDRQSRRSWGIGLLALQVVLAGILLVNHQRAASALPEAPAAHEWQLPTPDNGLTILTGVERANPIAQSWREEAVLAFASLQVDWSTDPPPDTITAVSPFGWLRLVYVAPVNGAESDYAALSMLFERVSGSLVSSSVSAWNSGPPPEPLLDGVTVTDETAILAGELSGGTEFRAACPGKRNQTGISLTIDPTTGARQWNLVYREQGNSAGGPMRISVNAVTGEVRDVRAGSLECAA